MDGLTEKQKELYNYHMKSLTNPTVPSVITYAKIKSMTDEQCEMELKVWEKKLSRENLVMKM